MNNRNEHLQKQMRIAIALPAPDTLFESILPNFDDEVSNNSTRIRFNPKVFAIQSDHTIRAESINGTNNDSRVTDESVPISSIVGTFDSSSEFHCINYMSPSENVAFPIGMQAPMESDGHSDESPGYTNSGPFQVDRSI